jgi:hypothetical protein
MTRQLVKWLLLCMTGLAALLPQVAAAKESKGNYKPVDGYDTRLVIENGIIGIAKVRAIYTVLNGAGRFDLMIITEDDGFTDMAGAMKALDRPVLAEVPGTDLVLWLKAHPACRYLYGHVQATGQRVYVLPAARSGHKG